MSKSSTVKYGKWDDDNCCSICHHEAIYTAENIRPEYDWTFGDGGDEEEVPTGEVLYDKVYVKSRFCPACGAKMLNAEEEQMREILFRGWVKDENRWIYGMVIYPRSIKNEIYTTIIPVVDGVSYLEQIRAVAPDTVGQYTGCEDKHGKKIFEGDIVLKRTYQGKKECRVVFSGGVFHCGYGGGSSTACHPYTLDDRQIEVVGNAYDLPEE